MAQCDICENTLDIDHLTLNACVIPCIINWHYYVERTVESTLCFENTRNLILSVLLQMHCKVRLCPDMLSVTRLYCDKITETRITWFLLKKAQ